MAEKKSFIFYFEWLDAFEDLSDEEVGQLIKALIKFAKDGTKTTFRSRSMKILFKLLTADIQRDSAKYEEILEKRRKGGRTRAQQMLAQASSSKHEVPVNVNVNVNDNVNDNDNVNVVNGTTTPTLADVDAYFKSENLRGDPNKFFDYYNNLNWTYKGSSINWKSRAKYWSDHEHINKFSNFHQREYDYEELEKKLLSKEAK